MMKIKTCIALLAVGCMLNSCSKDDGEDVVPAPRALLELDLFDDLVDLGEFYHYEGWITVDGDQVSTGKFSKTSKNQSFSVLKSDLDAATAFMITIESKTDAAPNVPSSTRLLSGSFEGNTAKVDVYNAIGDFSTASNVSGEFLLAAPTSTTPAEDATSGIWFQTISGTPGLNLPTLANGWVYQGWVAFQDASDKELLLSTGTFTDTAASDNASFYSGPNTAPSFPGEDFLVKPDILDLNISFPLSIPRNRVFITIEPTNDLETTVPFFLQPLTGIAGDDELTSNTMDFIKSIFPEGRVVKN